MKKIIIILFILLSNLVYSQNINRFDFSQDLTYILNINNHFYQVDTIYTDNIEINNYSKNNYFLINNTVIYTIDFIIFKIEYYDKTLYILKKINYEIHN